MRNLGPSTARMLAEIGVRDERDLRALGAVGAYVRLRFACVPGLSLNALYAMQAAIDDIDWRAVSAKTKTALRSEVERVIAAQQRDAEARRLPLNTTVRTKR